jgi:hypothetical protein
MRLGMESGEIFPRSCSDYKLAMGVTLDKPLLEKIEELQNPIIASVTGGIRNEVENR